jgi:hypothetical protein
MLAGLLPTRRHAWATFRRPRPRNHSQRHPPPHSSQPCTLCPPWVGLCTPRPRLPSNRLNHSDRGRLRGPDRARLLLRDSNPTLRRWRPPTRRRARRLDKSRSNSRARSHHQPTLRPEPTSTRAQLLPWGRHHPRYRDILPQALSHLGPMRRARSSRIPHLESIRRALRSPIRLPRNRLHRTCRVRSTTSRQFSMVGLRWLNRRLQHRCRSDGGAHQSPCTFSHQWHNHIQAAQHRAVAGLHWTVMQLALQWRVFGAAHVWTRTKGLREPGPVPRRRPNGELSAG